MTTFDVPILFIVFNRPQFTSLVFDTIRKIKPQKLYIAADGPRHSIQNDEVLCSETREICNKIDWECEVNRLYRDHNLGCAIAVSTAIDWLFENEEFGIILEDDCLPVITFFSFCETLLKKYKNNYEIMHISGSCHVPEKFSGDFSYYFSKYEHVWGWATWRRSWKLYDFNLVRYNIKNRLLIENKNKRLMLDRLKNESEKFTWDYQWYFSISYNNGICITPKNSLIKNIGFGERATNTFFKPRWIEHTNYSDIFIIQHPPYAYINSYADKYLTNRIYKYSLIKNLGKKILILVNKYVKRSFIN